MAEEIFLTCSMCGKKWKTRDDFLDDVSLEINGYQVDFERLEWSLFLFTHMIDECHSTIAVQADRFIDLYSGKKYKGRKTRTEDCPGYCMVKDELGRCDALCECAFNREVIQIIRERHQQKEFSEEYQR